MNFPGFRRLAGALTPGAAARWALAWPAVAVFLVPPFEFIQRGQYGGETAGAVTAMFLLLFTCLACVVALPGGWRPAPGPAGWVVAAMLAAAGVSAGANGFLESLPGVFVVVAGAAGFLFVSGHPAARASLAAGLAAGGALAGLYALVQAQGGIVVPEGQMAALRSAAPALAEQVAARVAEGRAFSFFVYPNALAGYLILALPFCVAGWMERPAGRKRLAWGGAAVLAASGLVASRSLGAAAALGIGVVAVPAVRRAGWGLPVIAAAGLFAAVVAWRGPGALGAGASAKAAHIRAILGTAPSVPQALVGRGPGAYGEAARAAMEPRVWARHAHSWPVETWVEQGLLGLLPLAGFLVLASAGWVRVVVGGRGTWRPALAVAWAAGLLHGLVDLDYALVAVAFPWWCLTGWLVAEAGLPGLPWFTAPGRGWRELASGAARFGRRAAPFLPALLVLPLVVLKGTPSALWAGSLLGACVAVFWAGRCLGWTGPVLGAIDLPWVALLVLGAFWALFPASPDMSRWTMLEAAGLFAGMLLLRMVARRDPRLEASMRRAVAGATAVMGVWAVVETAATGDPARTSFPSPNFLGAFLAFGGALALGALRDARGRMRSLWACAGLLAVAGIVASRSAGAGVAACVVGAGWLAMLAMRSRGARRIALIAGMGVIIFAAGWAVSRVDALSVVQRVAMWREAARLVVIAPEGWGPGCYGPAVLRVQEPSITSAGVGRFSLVAQFAHCEPLQFAAEWGIAGLVLAGLGLLLAWRSGGRGTGHAWRVALGAVLVHGLVDFPLRAPPILVLAAAALAFMTVGVPPVVHAEKGKRGAGAAAVVVAVALWAGLTWVRPALLRYAMEGVSRAASRQDFRDAAGWYVRAAGAWPIAAVRGGDGWLSSTPFGILGNARNLLRDRKLDEAASAFRRVIALEPFCLEAHVGLGDVARKRGDRAGARQWYRKALLLRGRLARRPGLNEYEKALVRPDPVFEREVRGRLLDLGGGR